MTAWTIGRCVAMALVAVAALPIAAAAAAEPPPAWAFPVDPPGGKPLVIDDSFFAAPDLHPGDHPAPPPIVKNGRKPDLIACGFCHRIDGHGGPENANIAGLPADYIVQQMADFKSGKRSTSVPERLPPAYMIKAAKAATAEDVKAAAAYFASIKQRANVRVVESKTAPKTIVAGGHLAALPGGTKEPLGDRIVEVPSDLAMFQRRDARAQFVAYVPPGSLRRGKELVTTGGGGRTVRCADCHGDDLRGLDAVPGLAGRSPSYLVRQLYDFKHGARKGVDADLMMPTVAKLTVADMIAIAAYAASLGP